MYYKLFLKFLKYDSNFKEKKTKWQSWRLFFFRSIPHTVLIPIIFCLLLYYTGWVVVLLLNNQNKICLMFYIWLMAINCIWARLNETFPYFFVIIISLKITTWTLPWHLKYVHTGIQYIKYYWKLVFYYNMFLVLHWFYEFYKS